MVAGLPSGGTSLVAGLLHHLGVDMGDIPTERQQAKTKTTRTYLGFECTLALRTFGALPATSSQAVMIDTARAYADERLVNADGPCGFKLNAMVMLGNCDGVERLPIEIVHVTRDLAATFESDIRYAGDGYARACLRGAFHLALRQLVRRVPPVCEVSYEQTRREPVETVAHLVRCLRIMPTFAQLEAAASFVVPAQQPQELAA